MMRRGVWTGLVLLLCGAFSPWAHAAFGLEQLMAELAQNKGGRARFVELRHVALLDKPLEASGEMVFEPPHRLEKRTVLPKPETLVLDKDTVTLVRDKRRMSIQLSSRPEAMAFADSIRSTLLGDRRSLEAFYALTLSGDSSAWTLELVPNDASVAALVKRITLSGGNKQVRKIAYLQADGDRTELLIEPIAAP